MNQPIVITIDGPAGAGKSTVARQVARKLALLYLDTGAIYRAVALAALRAGIDPMDEAAVTALANDMVEHKRLKMETTPTGETILLDNLDISQDIRTPNVSHGASLVSVHPGVRQALLQMQRDIARQGGVVVEGRDTGTVVFPSAGAKFFLTASIEERARRRVEQLRQSGQEAALEDMMRQVAQRDDRDTHRATAPLRRAADAIEIDCSRMTAEQVIETIVNHVRDAL